MSFELAIALRYLKTRRHGLFAFLTTLIAVGGVTLGVAALIVTLAVMSGFRSDIQNKTLGIQPHIVLLGTERDSEMSLESLESKIKTSRGVKSVAPFILGQTLLKSARNSQGVVLRGIWPEKEFSVTEAKKTLISGSWSGLENSDDASASRSHHLSFGVSQTSSGRQVVGRSVVLGKELARNLAANLDDELLLFSPTESAAMGAMASIPRIERYKVGGIFESGMYEFDANMAFISLPNAQRLFGMDGVSGIGIKTMDLEKADAIAAQVGAVAGPKYWARSWLAMNRNLFSALKLEKIVMTIILTMIVLVASFTIISNLILLSIEKAKDIGILRALGASLQSIKKIFLYAGMALGSAGILLGTILGIAIVEILDKTKWIKLPEDVYYIDTLPVKLSGWDISLVLISAFLITVLSAVYPATQAAKVNPVDAIRYG